MIAKRIDRKTENDNFRALALYVGGFTERNPEEKMLDSWVMGCESEDYTDVLMEIDTVQDLNTAAEGFKTYHLMLSFRPEDEARLTPEIMRDIESRFSAALGYSDHQRCCGVHKNTNNMHMHIAYNMINPMTFRRHHPYRDFITLARVRKEIEQAYGLVVDNGIEPGREPKRPNIKAQTMEAHSGQESFDAYVQRHKPALMERLAAAENWQDVHKALAEYGIGIKPADGRKSGLVLCDRHNKKYRISASALDRSTSGPALTKRFGSYEAAEPGHVRELARYEKRPLQREPNRGRLYDSYLADLAEKKHELGQLRRLKDAEYKRRAEIYDKWSQRRKELQNNHKLTSKDRWALIQEVYLKRAEELAADEKLALASKAKEAKTQEIRKKYPFSSWTDYLKKEAMRGNETALDILRSKKVVLEQEPTASRHEPAHETKAAMQRHKAVLKNANLATKDKKRLVAVGKLMDKMATELKVTISPSGVLILALPSGGTVRDNGKRIYFSSFDAHAQDVAREYAKARWGKLGKQAGENCFILTSGRINTLER